MKKIYIIFNDQEQSYVSNILYNNLYYVFGNHVDLKLCFLDESSPADLADGDLYLVLYENRVYKMKKYISSLENVLVLSRTIQKKFLTDLFSIPEGTHVLVVNDSEESTLQTTNLLYELGLNHLHLHPYKPELDPEKYQHIEIAITPNEQSFVPSFIQKIFDIEDRYLDVSTMIKIIAKLDLDNKEIIEHLLSYSEIVSEPVRSSNRKYVGEHLKNIMLTDVMNDANELILLTDRNYKPEYANKKAIKAFSSTLSIHADHQRLKKEFPDFYNEAEFSNKLFNYNNVNYLVAKTAVKYGDQLVGYSFVFNDETDIKDIGENLNKNLSKTGLVAKYSFTDFIYQSHKMEKTVELAKHVAATDYTVLITGESGTGKELLAQSIHNHSMRKTHPFVAINCAALPESLLESELFGYEKGAFTGASKNGKTGLFEQANRGTIFLDEIGDMSLNLQARLLRVLQEKQIMRLGSDRVISVDIRIVAATNKNLLKAISNHEFREDLYFRLCNIPLEMPALRERPEDILYLLEYFLGDKYKTLSQKEKERIKNYSWPGNVRELKNVSDYYSVLNELPSTIGSLSSHVTEGKNTDTLTEHVLRIIRENTTETSGIGRTAILYKLKEQGITLSDDKLRKKLAALADQEKIIIGKGRKGCMINR